MKLSYNDAKHQYRLDGKLISGVTSIAGLLDDTTNLDKWKQRMVILGLSSRADLLDRARKFADDKQELNSIAWQAMSAAKAGEAAARGTDMHRVIERHVKGLPPSPDTSFTRAVIGSWERAMKEAGLEVAEEYTERIILHPDVPAAGRMDHIFKRKTRGKLFIADLKSGGNAVAFPHKIAIQLAMYAYAPLMAGDLPEDGGSTEVFEPMPAKLDKKVAYIVHMPTDGDEVPTAQIHEIDIAEGWKAAQTSIAGLAWRKTKNLTKLVVEQPLMVGPASDERVAWIKGRLGMLAMVDGAKPLVISRWPSGVTPKPPWTDSDVDALNETLATVERDCEASFPTKDPILTGTGGVL